MFRDAVCISGACYTADDMCTAGTDVINGGVEETGTEPNIERRLRMLTMAECCSSTNNGLSYRDGTTCSICPICYATPLDCGDDGNLGRLDFLTENDCCANGGESFSNGMETCMACPSVPVCYGASNDCGMTGDQTTLAFTTETMCCNYGGMSFDADDGSMCATCPDIGMGMDPHFSVPLLDGKDMCFSMQGVAYFAFNLISDPIININSYFIPPEPGQNFSDVVTFLGDIGITVQPEHCMGHCSEENITKISISASDRSVAVDGSRTILNNRDIRLLIEDGVARINLGEELGKEERPNLIVEVKHPSLAFKVQFVNEHLDLIVKDYSGISSNAHGIMGQFLHRKWSITEDGFLRIDRKKIRFEKGQPWDFMHSNKECLHAKPSQGIQADGIIEGDYTDYIVEGLHSPEFKYSKFKL
ncbi:uncharacterized protein [Dysidea avara]|uniref:uncharacterized protein isoform X2 n=1 Tax=Dysidea avara TaxID=196820 RepID=UPI00332B6341